MARKFFTLFALFAACAIGGCNSFDEDDEMLRTSVDIQAMQTRNFDCSFKVAFAAVIDVFQDLGFVIQSSDSTTGLVIAKSNTTSATHGFRGGYSTFSGLDFHTDTSWQTGTAHVEQVGERTVSIRVSFVRNKKISHEFGATEEESRAIVDGNFYTRFFEKIDKSIFVRHNIRRIGE
jgi:fluoride ion exporter CrcB/FEX